MSEQQILAELNNAQKDAVCSAHQFNMVLAGAGSGKTRVLVQRLAYLVKVLAVDSRNILMVTFTNKAAKEMLQRAERQLQENLRGVWIGTFHAICLRILRANNTLAGLKSDFQVIASDDKRRILRRIIAETNLDSKKYTPESIGAFISKNKQIGKRAEAIEATTASYVAVKQVYLEYQRICRNSHIIDFDEILLLCFEILNEYPELLQSYRNVFKHIMVDEFQDTSTIQYLWIKLLVGKTNSLMIVGDDDQSIYGWRGAIVGNMINFDKEFKGTAVFRLEQNYRSSKNILTAANAVIQTNPERLSKQLWTESEQGNSIDLYQATDERDEANAIVRYIDQYLANNSNLTLDDCAVLYRVNSLSRNIEEKLRAKNINYRIYGGLKFYDRSEIRNALAYLKIVANPDDDSAVERVLNFPPRGIGKQSFEKVSLLAKQYDISLWRAIQQALAEAVVTAKAKAGLTEFCSIINRLQQKQAELSLKALVAEFYKLTDILGHYRESAKELDQTRVENLQELLSSCEQFSPIIGSDNQQSILQSYLETIALDTDDQTDETAPALQLMTVHSAKGLEFSLVVLCGLEQGLFPSYRSIEEGNITEETRLCYVALTRAEKQLLLTNTQFRNLYGRSNIAMQSEFLRHIPIAICNRVSYKPEPKTYRASLGFDSSDISNHITNNFEELNSDLPRQGTSVVHKTFGSGVINGFEGSPDNLIIIINFNSGTKRFLYNIAKSHLVFK